MMEKNETIFALSSGALPSGVGIIRISGPKTRFVLEMLCGRIPGERVAELMVLRDPETAEKIDRGLVLFMRGPGSFTGEDVGELQLHGSKAVISKVLEVLGNIDGLIAAERGEFARRAFENGKLDLTEIEGLADLIDSETENQRRQALREMEGGLRAFAEDWRVRLISLRAEVEAQLDFSDEDDVDDELASEFWDKLAGLEKEIGEVLATGRRGELIRDGVQIVVVGKPNAGKTSLVNCLAGREVGIVTDEPGTTRDVLEARISLGGYAADLIDTAGLRVSEERIEKEGIRRAIERSHKADIVLWVAEDEFEEKELPDDISGHVLKIMTKTDVHGFEDKDGDIIGISVLNGSGIEMLRGRLESLVEDICGGLEAAVVCRARQRKALEEILDRLGACRGNRDEGFELIADDLRAASDAIGRLTGRIDVEDVLDALFRDFCIGK